MFCFSISWDVKTERLIHKTSLFPTRLRTQRKEGAGMHRGVPRLSPVCVPWSVPRKHKIQQAFSLTLEPKHILYGSLTCSLEPVCLFRFCKEPLIIILNYRGFFIAGSECKLCPITGVIPETLKSITLASTILSLTPPYAGIIIFMSCFSAFSNSTL